MKSPKYYPTIGLEIHAQLKTKSKMFCACPNTSWKIGVEELKPNSAICPICAGQPGTLPTINREAVDMVVKTGLALNCKIAHHSKFDRKNYFYPDLPKGYQISQYDQPLCTKGYLLINNKKIGLTRIHLEEDTGRLLHPAGTDYSLVDLNRAGIPLMELVTEPDLHSATDAKNFCQTLQGILRSLNSSDADMEKSQMRCEVNISLNPLKNKKNLGTKVEIKNLNSFKAVERSIEYEIIRQTKLLNEHQKIVQETRGWHEKEQSTYPQRLKEDSHDYRYFPEPDLPPLKFTSARITALKNQLPELPVAKAARFMADYGFTISDARQIVSSKELAGFTENVMTELRTWLEQLDELEVDDDPSWDHYKTKLSKLVANWLINKLGGIISAHSHNLSEAKITPENFAELITLIYRHKVNSMSAQKLLEKMVMSGGDPTNILADEGLHLLENVGDLEPVIDKIIRENPDQASSYRAGKTALLKYFIGLVMKKTSGQANPKMAEELLIQKLS